MVAVEKLGYESWLKGLGSCPKDDDMFGDIISLSYPQFGQRECLTAEEIKMILEADIDEKPEPPSSPPGGLVEVDSKFTSSAGVTNSTVFLHRDSADNGESWASFKKDTHCSQEVVVSYGDNEADLMHLGSFKLVEVSNVMFNEVFQQNRLILIEKKQLNVSVVNFFLTNDISSKRCLVKCSSIIHGLALLQKSREISSKEMTERKRNNLFSNYQRPDRTAGLQLVKNYKLKYRLSSYPDKDEIEAKTDASIDIYNAAGYLVYTSKNLKHEHAVFYRKKCQLYFVKEKYREAFGKVVVKKKSIPNVKVL